MLRTRSFRHDGRTRSYKLYTPARMPIQPPLVLVFHGNHSNGSGVMWESRFNEVADAEGFAIVYPDGLPISNRLIDRNRLCWNDGRKKLDGSVYYANDLGFIKVVLDDIGRNFLQPDAYKIFSAGYSNGGHFALRLSQEYPWIRAAASLGGQRGPNDWMTAKWPKSVMLINGTMDGFAPFNGGKVPMQTVFDNNAKPVVQCVDNWNAYNRADTELTIKVDGNAKTYEFIQAAANLRTKLIVVAGMGHVWPGGNAESPYLGPEDSSILGSAEMWKFFKDASQ